MRGANQKLKLLYLKQFFEEKTDEQHPATMEDIRKYLTQHEVDAEHKSIGTDMDALEQFGMPVRDKDMLRNKKYFLQERTFKPSGYSGAAEPQVRSKLSHLSGGF